MVIELEELLNMKKLFTLAFVLVILAGGAFAAWNYSTSQQNNTLNNLQTVTAARNNLTATVGATGVVRSNQSGILVWKTSGTVDTVFVEAGDTVEEGQVLAALLETSLAQNIILARADLSNAERALDDLLNSDTFRRQSAQAFASAERAVLEAEAALEAFDEQEYKDELEDARAEIIEARDELRTAREDFEPYENWDENNQTRRNYQEALDEAQLRYDEAVRNLRLLELDREAARANLNLAQARLADAEREFERLSEGPDPAEVTALETRIAAAQATLALAELKVPFAGTITEVHTNPGNQAATGQNAFRIDDLSRLLVDVRVTEVDINRISLGQPVVLSFDAIPGQEYEGRVSRVSPVGNTIQGVVEFLFSVELEDADERVRPGMTAAVNVVVNRLENVLVVPNRAVRLHEGQRVVYVIRNNNLERAAVTLGASSDTMSEVISGNLQAGDTIVLNPPTTFGNGGPPFMRR
jgi:HlyD family secretion protein